MRGAGGLTTPRNQHRSLPYGIKWLMKRKEKAMDWLMKEFEQEWHVATGIFSTKMMFDVLRNENRNDIAYRIANKEAFRAGDTIDKGALPWKHGRILIMFIRRTIHVRLYQRMVLPLTVRYKCRGARFEKIIIQPQPAGDLTLPAAALKAYGEKLPANGRSKIIYYSSEADIRLTLPRKTSAPVQQERRNRSGRS